MHTAFSFSSNKLKEAWGPRLLYINSPILWLYIIFSNVPEVLPSLSVSVDARLHWQVRASRLLRKCDRKKYLKGEPGPLALRDAGSTFTKNINICLD